MKAFVLEKEGAAAEAFVLREKEKPVPKKGEVLIKVAAFGLNYADVMARNGLYNDRPPLPCVLGYEVVGTVEALGENVQGILPGDRVLGFTKFNGYAEYCATDARGVVPLPEGISNAEACALGVQYCTAWFAACEMVTMRKNDKVLVHAAAGGVGTALVQIAKSRGAEIFGTAGSDEKIAHLKAQGVDHAINYRKEDWVQAVQKIGGKRPLDLVFDPIGASNFNKGFKLLNYGGRIVSFGVSIWSGSSGNLLDKLKLAWGFGIYHPIALLMKSQGIIGLNLLHLANTKPDWLHDVMHKVVQEYKNGTFKPVIDSVHPYTHLAEAHTKLESRKTVGKVVVEW